MIFHIFFCLAITIVLLYFCYCLLENFDVGLTNNFLWLLKIDFLDKRSIDKKAYFIKGKHYNFLLDIIIEFLFEGLDSLQNFETNLSNIKIKKIFVQDVFVDWTKYYDKNFSN